ncbi:unnamed protein product [Mytilus edulis]|uniref:LRRNT domain-containing protein n=1 Tax=Mytilus edulis TaxID=6550 RepID=A0A8S3T5I6_MYTED|nr:unnamed protein product [Mytilus edulis]
MKVAISVIFLLVMNIGLVKGSCPSVCSCSSPYQELLVDCRSRSLGNIPADLVNDTYNLDLNHNNITAIDVQFCKKMPQLKHLNLESNPLTCDCTIYPFWSWLVGRPNTEPGYIYGRSCIGHSATCSNGTLVRSLQNRRRVFMNNANTECRQVWMAEENTIIASYKIQKRTN